MPRHVAFLRGVSPMNAKMADLRQCFESAGFGQVKTVLASGNVVFDTPRAASPATLQRKCEAAMAQALERGFVAIVRPVDFLERLIEADPFARFKLPRNAKRIVTFLREPTQTPLKLPIASGEARILAMDAGEIFTAYVPQPGNPVFMNLIEKTFGKDLTTRTWETVKKCAAA
jgi:uncharacterized protein (DUF1697 family)